MQQQLVSCLGSSSMLSSPSTDTSLVGYERVFNKAHSSPLVHFGERVLAHVQATPPSQKLHLRAQAQKHYSLWLGKCVITGMHIVAHEGQILKTRTVTRLVKEQQFNAVEFNKIILPPHESEASLPRTSRRSHCSSRTASGHSSCNKSQRC